MTQSIIDIIGREEVFKVMEKSVLKVAEENAQLGFAKAVKIDGVVRKVYPDGRVEPVSGQGGEADGLPSRN